MSIPNKADWKGFLNLYDRIAIQALEFYPGLSAPKLRLLNYSENATYLVEDCSNKYILRASRPGYHTKPEIESELVWLNTIHANTSIEVHLPVPNKKGEYIQTITFENDPQEYYCTMFTFLKGDPPDEETESELIRHFEKLGEITAQLHEHSINWSKTEGFQRPFWDFETILGQNPKWGRWQDGIGITQERAALFQQVSDTIKQRLERFGKGRNKFGMIHADIRLANFIIEGQRIKVIDFDDCGFGWYLFDLAASLSFIEHKAFVPGLIHSWLRGYRKVRPLSKQEQQEIPTFIMMRRLMLISWIGSRNNETTQKMGRAYTMETVKIAQDYLKTFKV
ncbi:phosphotransferase enzyme family protein [Peribacillus glennii]|uniref:Serine kinase n=1 Tax=Peribacillus glennii TaxID=2303991 RepID=A0A372L7Z6_9BACI|nr:phosphotransferase [Peribacillus glennii]RFU60885.1 serine kinase [Peribacillus glennii]